MTGQTTDYRQALRAKSEQRKSELAAILKEGDLLTHTRCMGHVEEHFYTGMDGLWVCGVPTKTTLALLGGEYLGFPDNDIWPLSITHINRMPVGQFLDNEILKVLENHIKTARYTLQQDFAAWRQQLESMTDLGEGAVT